MKRGDNKSDSINELWKTGDDIESDCSTDPEAGSSYIIYFTACSYIKYVSGLMNRCFMLYVGGKMSLHDFFHTNKETSTDMNIAHGRASCFMKVVNDSMCIYAIHD